MYKVQKKVLKDGIDVKCKEMLEKTKSLAQEYKFQILAMEVMPDHIHLLVDCRPQFYISDMIKIEGESCAPDVSFLYPELKKELGRHLWNPSYCAVTVSDRAVNRYFAYIEGAEGKIPLKTRRKKRNRKSYPVMV